MPEPWACEVWPAHPAPDPGECLTSYLLRLADANGGVPVRQLLRDAFPARTHAQQLRVLRWEYPIDDWGRLPLRTQRAPAELERLTVAPWVAKFRAPPAVAHPGNRSPASALQGAIAPTLRVCPRCLAGAPSVPLLWRLTPVVACLEHGCRLQAHCPDCAQPLGVIEPAQRPGHCARCGADLRTARMIPADAATLASQQRRQAALRWLLDPASTLVPPAPPGDPPPATALPRLIGAKLRALREQAGWSVATLARRLAVTPTTIGEVERGRRVAALPLYLAYLEALDATWPEVAARPVPAALLHPAPTPLLPLRRCPTLACPHAAAPSATGVVRLLDLPARQVARFRCKACGRTFTRAYDGALQATPSRPPIRPGDPPPVVKPAAEIERLVVMGRQGLPNRQIARQLGWGEKTVRSYWIALRLETEVHQAQAHRRAQAVRRRHARLRHRVEAIVAGLAQREEAITLASVARTLGRQPDYLQTVPAVAALVRSVAARHTPALRQRRAADLATRLEGAIATLKDHPGPPSTRAIAHQVGLERARLQVTHPDLYARVRQAVEAERVARRTALRQGQIAQIHAAASRLVAAGSRLTYTGLLKAAGVDRYYGFHDPLIHDVLEQWIGDPRPHG